mmetsp:Transcript_29151/g.83556  ORF Transcript_29151/g.83556 Transcript_29151/m.83556 type:complete len:201 (+) Transcript_29151:70-672(+)
MSALGLTALIWAATVFLAVGVTLPTKAHVEVQGDGGISLAHSNASAPCSPCGKSGGYVASTAVAELVVSGNVAAVAKKAPSPAKDTRGQEDYEVQAVRASVPGNATSLLATQTLTKIFGLGTVVDIILITLIALIVLFFLWGGTWAGLINNPFGALTSTVSEARERFADGIQREDFAARPGSTVARSGDSQRTTKKFGCC